MPCESVSFSDLEEGLELGLPRSCDASMKRDVGRGEERVGSPARSGDRTAITIVPQGSLRP